MNSIIYNNLLRYMNELIQSLAYLRILGILSSFAWWGKKILGIFWEFFCDAQRMKRVWDLTCLTSLKGLDAHVFQKLARQYLSSFLLNSVGNEKKTCVFYI